MTDVTRRAPSLTLRATCDLRSSTFTRQDSINDYISAQGSETLDRQAVPLHERQRLIAGMLPLTSQVQICCDNAKGAAARLAGIDPPKHEDNEKTLAELKSRIAKTIEFMNTVRADQFNGAETREIVLKFPSITLEYTGQSYLAEFVLPNFYFHLTAAYAILRKNGVKLGKANYLGGY